MDELKLYGKNRDQLDSIVQTVRIFSEDMQVLFGLDMCTVLETWKWKKGEKLTAHE